MSVGLNLTGQAAQELSRVYNRTEAGHLHIDALKFLFAPPFFVLAVSSFVEGSCQATICQGVAIIGDCVGSDAEAVQSCAEEALAHLNQGLENSWSCLSAAVECLGTADTIHYGT
jgi:hypothetical protein